MNKILIICGPTSTGKTDLALRIGKKIPSNLISADSRQVYKGMDLGTGKDIPTNFRWIPNENTLRPGYYKHQNTYIYGYDLVTPDQDFSVSHYYQYAVNALDKTWNQGKLAIICGGTGLYINAILDPPATLTLSPNTQLRYLLSSLSVQDLRQKLSLLDSKKYHSMNHSDCHNPRRLIRAIEVASSPVSIASKQTLRKHTDILTIGLNLPNVKLDKLIEKRVDARNTIAFDQEVKLLMNHYPDWSKPAFSAMGYKEWRLYLEGVISQPEALNIWKKREKQYARRQKTWFNNLQDIEWFDLETYSLEEIVARVQNWYA